MLFIRMFVCGLAAALSVSASAAAPDTSFRDCPQFFAGGHAPVSQKFQQLRPRALCYDSFAVLHSGVTKTPLFAAEKLNRSVLLDAKGEKRRDKFFADARLPRAERAELEDYRGSGLDRGHMAAAAQMPNATAMAQSFSLANMVPQSRVHNQKTWAGIEKATRKYAMRSSHDVYVITGPVFDRQVGEIGPNRVRIPSHIFKLVYDSGTGRAWAHWTENSDHARASTPISYSELVRRTGIEFLPKVAIREKDA